ncbi:nucleotide exchange factor GrpE [Synechococcus sp. CS-1329]|uniref:nucleotide exchange factor GrpE n=1 Tax=Synechococcus sp. CS-1329 TaxID=2847975 RepID=UPI00223B1BC9|nr:nucleotide exchange factor GrpE [Synechococcus sp. CS-1329]MCT0218814.1 nucleotide exchange factor GrpE [Synechococcus sp. CS-1329]
MSGEATPFPQDLSAEADSLIQDLAQSGGDSPADTGPQEPVSGDPAAAAAEAAGQPPAQRLAAELETLRREHETLRSQYMRIAADFDNFRKRQSRDQEDLRLQIACSTLSEILPVVDNFDRARQQLDPQSEEAQALHRSYQNLYKQLVEAFKQLGVAPMRVEGEPFDPNLHEAVLREPSDLVNEDLVIEELQRGYQLNGRVLRHALVKVSMGPGPGASQGAPPLAQDGTAGGEESS